MRNDVMTWIGRLVGGVFGLGVLALIGAVVVMVRQAEGIPPWPIFMGIVGLVMLILLAGACLAMISIAVSARRGVLALQAMGFGPEADLPVEAAPMQGPTPAPEPETPSRAVRPGRVLVAER